MDQREFSYNKFFLRKFACSASVKMRSRRNFVLNIGFGRSPTSVFEVGFVKLDSKIVSWYQLPLLAYSVGPIKSAVEILKQCEEPQKIAASFKQNLKTDGYESRYDISSMGSLWK